MTPPVTIQAARDAAGEIGYHLGIRSIEQRRRMRLGECDDDRLVLAFAKAIAEERERAARIAEDFKATGYMSDRERDYCQAHGEEIATAIRATVGEVGNG